MRHRGWWWGEQRDAARDAASTQAGASDEAYQLIRVDGPKLHTCDLFYWRRTGGVSVIAHFAPA